MLKKYKHIKIQVKSIIKKIKTRYKKQNSETSNRTNRNARGLVKTFMENKMLVKKDCQTNRIPKFYNQ